MVHNDYHISVIRASLTRNLAVLSSDIYDEICHAFAHVIPATDGVKRISGLIYEETRGVLKIFLENVSVFFLLRFGVVAQSLIIGYSGFCHLHRAC